jgi:hypothetical protein
VVENHFLGQYLLLRILINMALVINMLVLPLSANNNLKITKPALPAVAS